MCASHVLAALPACDGPLAGTGDQELQCPELVKEGGACQGHTKAAPGVYAQCGSSGDQCLTTGPMCEPLPPVPRKVSFEEEPAGYGTTCPTGWTCTSEAQNGGTPSGTKGQRGWKGTKVCTVNDDDCYAGSPDGKRYLILGHDNEKGTARSPNFKLPSDVTKIKLRRCGGNDGPDSGFFVKRASDDSTLCSATNGENTNSFRDDECNLPGNAAGQEVYYFMADTKSGGWSKTFIDDIRMER